MHVLAMDKSKIDGIYDYFAFISYKDECEDADWAQNLQHKLEHYKFPTAIREENMSLPERVSPIYEYKSEATSGRIRELLWKALTSSKFLIVICSPNTTKSSWVDAGIKYFINSKRENYIIPFIVDGKAKSGDESTECFPKALLELQEEREIRGININEKGFDAAVIKVVAYMFSLKFDALWKRYERDMETERQKLVETNNRILRNLARAVAEKASVLVDEGDSYTARLLALEILPTEHHPDFFYTPEAEFALRKSMVKDNAVLRLHTNHVNDASISPDGNNIASISDDKTIKIWKSVNGELVHSISGNFHLNKNVSFSHDGRYIVAIDDSWKEEFRFIKIWEVKSGRVAKSFNFHKNSFNTVVRFSPLSDRLVVTDHFGNGFSIFDMESEKDVLQVEGHPGYYIKTIDGRDNLIYDEKLKKGHSSNVYDADFSPVENRVVTASNDCTARIWNTRTGKELSILEGHKDRVTSARYSHDGKHIVTTSYDGTARTWSSRKGKPIMTLVGNRLHSNLHALYSASFSHDGRFIATASSDKSVMLWDARKGKPLGVFSGHTDRVNSVVFSPDDRRIVSSSNDFTIRLWDISSKRERMTLYGHGRRVTSANFSPDGKKLVSCSFNGIVNIWNTDDWKPRLLFVQPPYDECDLYNVLYYNNRRTNTIAFSQDGNRILSASADNRIRIWDSSSGDLLLTVRFQDVNSPEVYSANFSNDGKLIVTSLRNHTLKVIDSSEGKLIATFDMSVKGSHVGDVMYSVFSHNDDYIASAGSDNTVKLWDVHGECLLYTFEGHSDTVQCVQFSHDDQYLVSASEDHTVKIWSVKNKSLVRTIPAHDQSVNFVSISPDDRLIASASSDHLIKIWDLKTGCLIETLEGHNDSVKSVTFSPNGRIIVSASFDSTIKVWDFFPLEELIQKAFEKCATRQLTADERHLYYLD